MAEVRIGRHRQSAHSRTNTTIYILLKGNQTEIKNLMNSEKMMILRPNKDLGEVIIDRDEHIYEVMSILDDTSTFMFDRSGKDTTEVKEKHISKNLKELLKKKLIDNFTYNELNPYLPYIRGLQKIHKSDIPIRPAV